jgi:hypothetical protein
MIEFYKGLVRKLVTPTEKQELGAKYPMASVGSPHCSAKSTPTGLMRHCWICTRPTHDDGPHVAHRDDQALAIWGSPKRGERPQWLITPTVGLPLVEEVPRR